MINRVYNIVVFCNIALNSFDKYLRKNNISGDVSKLEIPNYMMTYLNEKANRYLGFDYKDNIDHNEIFHIYMGSLIVKELDELIEYFEPKILLISNQSNIQCELKLHEDEFNITLTPFVVMGCDYRVTNDIKDYLFYYSGEMDQIVRD